MIRYPDRFYIVPVVALALILGPMIPEAARKAAHDAAQVEVRR